MKKVIFAICILAGFLYWKRSQYGLVQGPEPFAQARHGKFEVALLKSSSSNMGPSNSIL